MLYICLVIISPSFLYYCSRAFTQGHLGLGRGGGTGQWLGCTHFKNSNPHLFRQSQNFFWRNWLQGFEKFLSQIRCRYWSTGQNFRWRTIYGESFKSFLFFEIFFFFLFNSSEISLYLYIFSSLQLGCLRKWLLGFRESRNFIRKWFFLRNFE